MSSPKKVGRPLPRNAAHPQDRLNKPKHSQLDYQGINRAAIGALPVILNRWLPTGKRIGHEWLSLNPRRKDRHIGSFSINLITGRWADFASGDAGGDVISLAAYLHELSQGQAARKLAQMLGVRHG